MGRMARGGLAFVVIIMLLSLLPQAHAVAIGINRAVVDFTDVLRGGYAETTVTVTTDSPELVGGEVILEGDESSWIDVPREFNFSRDSPYELRIIVRPPLDAQVKDYDINLSVITGSLSRDGGGRIGTSTRASFRIPIHVRMTGTERIACTVGGVNIPDVERGNPVQVELSVINRGNVRINPRIELEVYDQLRTESFGNRSTDFGQNILPTVTANAIRSVSYNLQIGQYWARVSVPECDYAGVYTFDVLEAGAIKDDGELLRIDAQPWANTGDIIPINAVFRNKGARAVRASFRGTITDIDTGEIAKVINTEEYIVDPDVTAEIPTFFNPTVGGQYRVSGKVYYNSKLTVERETLINVNGSPVETATYSAYIIIFIIILILLLLILIRRKRSAQQS